MPSSRKTPRKEQITHTCNYSRRAANISERTLGLVADKPQVVRTEGAHMGPADMAAAGSTDMLPASVAEDTGRSSKDREAVRQLGGDGTSREDTRRI
jgi:hypothetical protein